MDVGMLWLDADSQRTIEEKVERAADYYRQKYGSAPDLCLVNKGMLAEERQIGLVQVQPAGNVLVHHFWLGKKAA
jgi:hypothetical protein